MRKLSKLNKIIFSSLSIFLFAFVAFGQTNTTFKAKQVWHTSGLFESPESVVYDETRETFYVSNGVGYEKNGKGFISKLSRSGFIRELKWIKDLNRPTGMSIHNNYLYVADIDELLIINLETKRIEKKITLSEKNPMLNDVSVTEKGEVYVTASGLNSVFQLVNNKLVLTSKNDLLLKYANGIITTDNKIITVGWEIAEIDSNSKNVSKLKIKNKLNDFDGLALDKKGNLFFTQVSENGKLWMMNPESGESKLIFKYDNYLSDFSLVEIDGKEMVVLATGNHKKKQYGVIALEIN